MKGFYCAIEHTHAKINMQDWSVFSQHLLSAGDCFHQISARSIYPYTQIDTLSIPLIYCTLFKSTQEVKSNAQRC